MLPMARLLQKEGVLFAYGGAVFSQMSQLHSKMPGHHLGSDIKQVPRVIEYLLTSPPPMPAYQLATGKYPIALKQFVELRSSLESEMWRLMQGKERQTHLNSTNKEFGNNIVAALTFGDLSFLSANLAWVEGLMANYQVPSPQKLLDIYLKAYYQAAAEVLGEEGALVVSWLAELLDQ